MLTMPRYAGLQLPTDSVAAQWSNKAEWNDTRSITDADFFTLHYSGRTISEVVGALQEAGVATVLDIRHAPVSMYKPDFSKNNLIRHLETAGIEYLHLPDLGIPRDIRGLAVGKPDRNDLWEWYDEHVVTAFVNGNLTEFLNFAEHPVALMCVEIDPASCHRHRLGLALERQGLRSFDL